MGSGLKAVLLFCAFQSFVRLRAVISFFAFHWKWHKVGGVVRRNDFRISILPPESKKSEADIESEAFVEVCKVMQTPME